MNRIYARMALFSPLVALVLFALGSCESEDGEIALCQGLEGEDEILCLRPDLVGTLLERKIAFNELYNSGRSDVAAIEKMVHQSSAEVFEYCVRQFESRALCLDEWLQAEIDQVEIEMSKPDEG